jgi:hypothetical protein
MSAQPDRVTADEPFPAAMTTVLFDPTGLLDGGQLAGKGSLSALQVIAVGGRSVVNR